MSETDLRPPPLAPAPPPPPLPPPPVLAASVRPPLPPPPIQPPTKRPRDAALGKPKGGIFKWIASLFSRGAPPLSARKVHPETAGMVTPPAAKPGINRTNTFLLSQTAGRDQLDLVAKQMFGVGKRWIATGGRESGLRDDNYTPSLLNKLATAGQVSSLSKDDLATAMQVFKKFDRDGDGKLHPDEMMAFWKHITFLTAADHAGSTRDADEAGADFLANKPAAMPSTFESGGMEITDFVKILQRFSAAELALAEKLDPFGGDDIEYSVILSRAASSLALCDAISTLPTASLRRAVAWFRKGDVKCCGSIRLAVAAVRLGLKRSDVPDDADLDGNAVLDFNEFCRSVLPRMEQANGIQAAAWKKTSSR